MRLSELLLEFKTKIEKDAKGRRVQKIAGEPKASIDIRHTRVTVVPTAEEVAEVPLLKTLTNKPKEELLTVSVVAPYALIQKAPSDEDLEAGRSWVRDYGPKLTKDDAHAQIHLKDALKGRTTDDYIDPADVDQMAKFGVEFLMSVSAKDLPREKGSITVLGRGQAAETTYRAIARLQVALKDPRTLLIPASSGHTLAKQFATAVSEVTGRKVYDVLEKKYGEMTDYIYDKKSQEYKKHHADIAWHRETLRLRDKLKQAEQEAIDAEARGDEEAQLAAITKWNEYSEQEKLRDKQPQSKKGQHTRHLAYKTQVANKSFHQTPEIAQHVDRTGAKKGPPVVIIDDNFYGGNTISDVVVALYREGLVPESINALTLHGLYDPK